jgi:Tfp pilus assembly protein PilE
MSNNKGFTIMEILVAVLVFFVVISSAGCIYTKTYAAYVKSGNKLEVQENMRFALKKMSRGLRQSASVVSCNGSEIVIKPAQGNNIYGYRYDPAQKEAEVNVGGVYLPLASCISDLSFDYDAGDRVAAITIKGQKGDSAVIEMSTKVQIRTGN